MRKNGFKISPQYMLLYVIACIIYIVSVKDKHVTKTNMDFGFHLTCLFSRDYSSLGCITKYQQTCYFVELAEKVTRANIWTMQTKILR